MKKNWDIFNSVVWIYLRLSLILLCNLWPEWPILQCFTFHCSLWPSVILKQAWHCCSGSLPAIILEHPHISLWPWPIEVSYLTPLMLHMLRRIRVFVAHEGPGRFLQTPPSWWQERQWDRKSLTHAQSISCDYHSSS